VVEAPVYPVAGPGRNRAGDRRRPAVPVRAFVVPSVLFRKDLITSCLKAWIPLFLYSYRKPPQMSRPNGLQIANWIVSPWS